MNIFLHNIFQMFEKSVLLNNNWKSITMRFAFCFQGTCRSMGCDGLLGSGSTRDMCGVCSGNNSTCESFNGKFQRKLRRGGCITSVKGDR